MRHLKSFNHLGRTSSHRKALLSNMASSLILRKRITTTIAKAKSLKVYVEPLITKSKEDNTQSRRLVFSYLQDKHAVSELFREVSPKIINRPGGYTRILKTGFRHGDNADMCIIELVDYNESMLKASSLAKPSTVKKSRRGGAKKKDEAPATISAGGNKKTDVSATKTSTDTGKKKAEAISTPEANDVATKTEESKSPDTQAADEIK
jgi:large subunit ribosomal protein L17